MTSRDFAYWLQGYFEINNINSSGLNTGPLPLNAAQVGIIQKHLSLVFAHEIDKSCPNQEKLNAIHNAPDKNKVIRC